ncbi:kinase-like domain-containing protein [Globomyces pollinis-pini]|nr:kinase-like domain-containing protein [Globomyces pollinis-pini]
MSRLRHPCILHVVEPLVDSKTMLAFASESFQSTLAMLLPKPSSNQQMIPTHEPNIDEFEIQSGLLQIVKALQFLHANGIGHLNLNPSNIYIDNSGDWKLGGFNYSHSFGVNGECPQLRGKLKDMPAYTTPHLGYFAPEVLLDDICSAASDVFSLGSLTYALFNSGNPILDCGTTESIYREKLTTIPGNLNLPISLNESVTLMVSKEPSRRIPLTDFLQCQFFNNNLVNTLKYLNSFLEETAVEKAKFLKTLPTLLQQFSFKTVSNKILPVLLEELKNHSMIPFLLPSLFWISERLSDSEFASKVIPAFKSTLFQVRDPPQAVLLLLSRIDLFVKKLNDDQFRTDLFPFIIDSLSSTNADVQLAASKAIPKLIVHLDFMTVKTLLLSKMEALFLHSKSIPTDGNSLLAIKSMLPSFDKATILERVLPLLEKKPILHSSLLILYVNIYKDCCPSLETITIGSKVIPKLWKLSCQCENTKQYMEINSVIDGLAYQVRENRMKHLKEQEQLEGILDMILYQ